MGLLDSAASIFCAEVVIFENFEYKNWLCFPNVSIIAKIEGILTGFAVLGIVGASLALKAIQYAILWKSFCRAGGKAPISLPNIMVFEIMLQLPVPTTCDETLLSQTQEYGKLSIAATEFSFLSFVP